MTRLFKVPDSDNVYSVGFDADAMTMDVVFHAKLDRTYRYHDVSYASFCKLVSAPSMGEYIHKSIIPRYRHSVVAKQPIAENIGEYVRGKAETVVKVPATVKPAAKTVPKEDAPAKDEDAFDAVINRPKKRS